MIKLEKDERCISDSKLLVISAGTYTENDLVELYHEDNPENVVSFHALYIKEGRFPE